MALAEAHRAVGQAQHAAHVLKMARSSLEQLGATHLPGSGVALPEHAGASSLPCEERNMIRCQGDVWSVTFDGKTVHARGLKGLRYLTQLLTAPGREFHVLELVALEQGNADDPVRRSLAGDAGEVLDAQAKEAYRRRLAEIDEDIEQALANQDDERAAQADAERAFLVRELSRGAGLGGRNRRFSSTSERARASVTRAIRLAIARLGEHHPDIGSHLTGAVHTGTFCSYQPDTPVRWDSDVYCAQRT
jgi:hypothetical protein